MLFCPFVESNFKQVGGLVTRNVSVFCLYWAVLCFKDMPNSIDFHERVFLHDVPARIIVPLVTWYRKCKLYIKNDTFLFFVSVI